MLMEKVLEAAKPQLQGKRVRDLTIGLSLMACELDTGDVGVSYVLRDDLPSGCSAFPFAQKVIDQPATKVAELIVYGADDVQRSVGASVLAAASRGLNIPDDSDDALFGVEFTKEDTVGMVGFIAPVAKQLTGAIKELIVFDKGRELKGDNTMLNPTEQQAKLLPKCDVVLLSGTTTINGTLESLLSMCSGAREVVMVGASTPMYAQGFRDTCLTRLAGSWWANNHKQDIFKSIALAGGIMHIRSYMLKKVLTIH